MDRYLVMPSQWCKPPSCTPFLPELISPSPLSIEKKISNFHGCSPFASFSRHSVFVKLFKKFWIKGAKARLINVETAWRIKKLKKEAWRFAWAERENGLIERVKQKYRNKIAIWWWKMRMTQMILGDPCVCFLPGHSVNFHYPCSSLEFVFNDKDIPIGKCPEFAVESNIESSVQDGKRQVHITGPRYDSERLRDSKEENRKCTRNVYGIISNEQGQNSTTITWFGSL